VILALLNPILLGERGAQPPPGPRRWRTKPACRLGTQRTGQFFILIAGDISKVAECRPRRDRGRERERERGRKSERDARMDWEECVSTSAFCSPEQGPNFLCLNNAIRQRSPGQTRLNYRLPGFSSLSPPPSGVLV